MMKFMWTVNHTTNFGWLVDFYYSRFVLVLGLNSFRKQHSALMLRAQYKDLRQHVKVHFYSRTYMTNLYVYTHAPTVLLLQSGVPVGWSFGWWNVCMTSALFEQLWPWSNFNLPSLKCTQKCPPMNLSVQVLSKKLLKGKQKNFQLLTWHQRTAVLQPVHLHGAISHGFNLAGKSCIFALMFLNIPGWDDKVWWGCSLCLLDVSPITGRVFSG